MKYFRLLFLLALAVLFAACNDAQADRQAVVRIPQDIAEVGELSGSLTILALGDNTRYNQALQNLRLYAELFNGLHPNVEFVFDTYGSLNDIADQTALSLRLMGDPPDIFHTGGSLIWGADFLEKVNLNALFIDFHDFFYGPRGIELEGYFTNIFQAAESQGGLFRLPFYVEMEVGFLNRRLFDAIGVDWSVISYLTIDEEIDYFLQIMDVFPDVANLWAYRRFSPWDVLLRESLYNLDTGVVSADTPALQSRMERAMQAYRPNRQFMNFTPFAPMPSTYWMSPARLAPHVLTGQSPYMRWTSLDSGMTTGAVIMMLAGHPQLQFSQPILTLRGGGNVGFSTSQSFSISRNAPNADLAWEFLRFMLEFDESLFTPYRESVDPFAEYTSFGWDNLPVNRARFENQLAAIFEDVYATVIEFTDLAQHINEDGHKAQTIGRVMEFYRGLMERADYEIYFNRPVLNSLVYPDFWLLYTNQQDITTTLTNIQNRLELYVAE